MNLEFYDVQHPILRRYIDFYYFFKTDDAQFDSKYYSFPSNKTPLSIHKNAHTAISEYSTVIVADDSAPPVAVVQGMRNRPLFANLRGRIDKVTIVFKPLGINRFVNRSFAEICPQDSQVFSDWERHPDYREFIEDFYRRKETAEKVAVLEKFLLSVCNPSADFSLIEKAIDLLTDVENERKINDVSRLLNLNVRTFNRMFKEHLGISPIGYKKIARFRRSLESRDYEEQFQCLTNLAYENNYYDQSYFTKIYRELAGTNPKKLFDAIKPVPDNKVMFRFIE